MQYTGDIRLLGGDAATLRGAGAVATIGFFDGVHHGHQFLIQHVRDEARRAGLQSMVVTLDRHPRQVLHQEYQPQLLTTPDMKLRLLRQTGVDTVAVLHFDERLASLCASDFMRLVLRDRLHVKELVIGYDNRFGHNRAEGFDDYVRYGRELGIRVIHNPALTLVGLKVSSSAVRGLLAQGEVARANFCLGHPYTISGVVVQGYREGRKLGFPTANLAVSGQLIPRVGVYAVRAQAGGETPWLPAMMDIGTRPTFDGTRLSLEVNIFDFTDDLYGQELKVQFVRRIRDERKFGSPQELAAQLEKDRTEARGVLEEAPPAVTPPRVELAENP